MGGLTNALRQPHCLHGTPAVCDCFHQFYWRCTPSPACPCLPPADLLSGQWELLYTTSASILGASRPALLRPTGPTYQVIGECSVLPCHMMSTLERL